MAFIDLNFDQLVVETYLELKTLKYTAEKLNTDPRRVKRALNRSGVAKLKVPKPGRKTPRKDQNERDRELVVDLYLNKKMSAAQIGKELGVGGGVPYLMVKNLGIERRVGSTKFEFDSNFFETIDSEHKAYWLGFLAADGYIHNTESRSKALKLRLSKKDLEHLAKFKSMIKATHPIMEYKYSSSSFKPSASVVDLTINSAKLVSDLIRNGVGERKTTGLLWPRLSSELERHFLRGMFDGDGCWQIAKRRRKRSSLFHDVAWSLCSNRMFLEQCQDFLVRSIGINKNPIPVIDRYSVDVSNLTVGGNNQARKLFHLMYDDCTVALDRKYDKVKALLVGDHCSYVR